MVTSQPLYDLTLPWIPEEEAHPTKWWIVTRVGPSVDLVYVQVNEGKAMKRMYNDKVFVDGMTQNISWEIHL